MNIFQRMKNKEIQGKVNAFIKNIEGLEEKEIEQRYLDNKELENNESLLTYLFFHYPALIRVLPIEFQKSRINSNLDMFKYGSSEAKKEIISYWLKDNKLFMNAAVVKLTDEEVESYIKLYFKQENDVAKLFMDDLRKVIHILSLSDLKETENIINKIKDKLTDRQWEYIIEVNPIFIKYASQTIQNKYAEDEKYSLYTNGEARKSYIYKQIDRIKDDINILDTMPIDVQKEFIMFYPFMINYIKEDTLVEILKYDINLIRFVNISALRDSDESIIYRILENIENKNINEIIDIFIDRGLLTAKGKLYRFDKKSNNLSYQYTNKIIRIIQSLSVNQVMSLINIDVNYVLPYIVPIYDDNSEKKIKENIIIDSNKRCLTLFESFYNNSNIYNEYYKVINKIYNEYLNNLNKYDFQNDFECVFDLFKLLFNKQVINNNSSDKIVKYIGVSLLYKNNYTEESKKISISMLNSILENTYKTKINNKLTLYELYSLEQFDKRLDFIDSKLLHDYFKYNFVNISTLLRIVKDDKSRYLFKKYYEIFISVYNNNKESLFKASENFIYYKTLISDIENKELSDKEIENLIDLLSTFGNPLNINHANELVTYDISLLKNFIKELSVAKDEKVYRNLICKYLFNKGYDEKGNSGWLEVSTIKQLCDLYELDNLELIKDNNKPVFTEEELSLFNLIKLLFDNNDFNILLEYIENIISQKIKRNIVAVCELFNKLKKYRCEIINSEIVTIEELEMLLIDNPNMIKKKTLNGVTVYSIKNNDFKVLCSNTDDGIHYVCSYVSNLDKNCYGYNKLLKSGSIRFTSYENNTLIKINKDRIVSNSMSAEFLIIVGNTSDDLIDIAKKNNIPIVEVKFD